MKEPDYLNEKGNIYKDPLSNDSWLMVDGPLKNSRKDNPLYWARCLTSDHSRYIGCEQEFGFPCGWNLVSRKKLLVKDIL